MKRFYRNTFSMMLIAGGLTLAFDASAQSNIVTFSFTNSTGDEVSFAPDNQPANANVSHMKRGTGVIPSPSGGRFSAASWPMDTTTIPLDTASYFTFTISPNTGFALNLDSLYFTERRSNTGIRDWSLRSSLDNFTSDIATVNVPLNANDRNHAIDLSAAYMNVSTPVTFRFYGYNAVADGGTWRVDNVKLTGSVAAATSATVVGFPGNSVTVAEDAGNANVLVSIANPSPGTASTVEVVVSGGSATNGTDYTFTTQTVTFPVGSSANETVSIAITDDTDIESAETIVLALQNPSTGVQLGNSTFTITITDNDTPPPVVPLRTIASVTGVDANGVATSVGATVRLRGITYGVNQRPSGLQFTMIDNTGGIGVFNQTGNYGYTFAQGDSIEVVGTISQFNGLTQINITGLTPLTTNNPLVAPMVVTQLGENTESELVRLANPVYITDATAWTGAGSGFTVPITDGTNTYDLRIDNDVNLYGMPAPVGYFYVTGIGGQFDSSSPHDSGYQLLPRDSADIVMVPFVGFAGQSQQVSEDAGTATVTVTITNQGATPTTVEVAITGGTADPADYAYSTQTLTFPANSTTSQTVTINITDDTQTETNETIIVSLQNPSTGAMATTATHTITITDNDGVGIADVAKATQLSVYPNPAQNAVKVQLGGINESANLQVFNSLGQVVATAVTQAGAEAHELNIASLPAGLYTVRLSAEGVVKTGTLVKF